MPLSQETLIAFGGALAIGALVGLEREKTKQKANNNSPLGIRTSIILSLFGAISAYLGQLFHPGIFLIAMIGMILLILSSHINLVVRNNRIGITTEISSLLVFLYGALCIFGYVHLALIAGIIMTFVLSLRKNLHSWVKKINQKELFDTLKFAIIAFIILPLLPNESYDHVLLSFLPTHSIHGSAESIQVLNPQRIWFMVVLISGISFIGYILVKIFGKKKGIGMVGILGGLYSSTATSLMLASYSKKHPESTTPFIAGIVLACATSFFKMFLVIETINQTFFARTFISMGLMFLFLMGTGLILFFKNKNTTETSANSLRAFEGFKTPFTLKNALKLALFLTVTLLIAKITLSYASIELYWFIAGAMAFFAIDDPIILSTATSAGTLLTFVEAKNIVLVAIFLNMIQKAGMIYLFGNRNLIKSLILIFTGLLLVTVIGFLYL